MFSQDMLLDSPGDPQHWTFIDLFLLHYRLLANVGQLVREMPAGTAVVIVIVGFE
jgi:hypothetical protein